MTRAVVERMQRGAVGVDEAYYFDHFLARPASPPTRASAADSRGAVVGQSAPVISRCLLDSASYLHSEIRPLYNLEILSGGKELLGSGDFQGRASLTKTSGFRKPAHG